MFNKINEPLIIKNDDFKRCILFISFPIIEYREEDLKILQNIVFEKSGKYDSKRKIAVTCINNHCLSYSGKISYIGNNAFLEFSLIYPSFETLKKDVLLDNLMFAKEMIYNPYLENGVFSKSEIDDAIKMYRNSVSRRLKDYDGYYSYRNECLIDEDNYLISGVFKDLSLLDNVTSEKLYDLYKSIIGSSPLIFLIGNVDENESKKLIKKVFRNNKKENIVFKKDYFIYARDIPKNVNIVREKTGFSTSGVYLNYKVRNINCYKDEVLLSIVRKLLDSGVSNILFKYLRQDNDLVYRTGAYNYDFGTLTLYSFTDSKDINQVFEIYDKAMNYISDIKYIKNKLPLIIEKARIDNELEKEKLLSILFVYVDEYLECYTEKYYDVIKNIKPIEVKDFIENRLIMVSKYIGEGVSNG